MSNKNITLTDAEQSTLTDVLLNAKSDKIKQGGDYTNIDKVIDKVTDRITYVKRKAPNVSIFDGSGYTDIYEGGTFKSEHGKFKIEAIQGTAIKVNGRWHHKSEFEPAKVISEKGKAKGHLR